MDMKEAQKTVESTSGLHPGMEVGKETGELRSKKTQDEVLGETVLEPGEPADLELPFEDEDEDE